MYDWAAGILDIGGHFHAHTRERGRHLHTYIAVGSANRELLQEFREVLQAGTVQLHYTRGRKRCWLWKALGNDIDVVLRQVGPYLQFKDLAAQTLLELRQTVPTLPCVSVDRETARLRVRLCRILKAQAVNRRRGRSTPRV